MLKTKTLAAHALDVSDNWRRINSVLSDEWRVSKVMNRLRWKLLLMRRTGDDVSVGR